MNNLNGPDSIKKGDYGYSSESLSNGSSRAERQAVRNAPRGSRRAPKGIDRTAKSSSKKLRNSTIIGAILLVIQLALSGYLVYLLMTMNISFITDMHFIAIVSGLVFFLILAFILNTIKKIGVKRAGKVISIIVCIAIAIAIYLLKPWGGFSGDKVDEDPFVVFVSATDTFGDLKKDVNERSDTNIIAAVNPKKHTVMMVSIPRDYYVPVISKNISLKSTPNSDKLTHLGLYGNGQPYNKKTGDKLDASGWQYANEAKWGYGKEVLMDSLKKLIGFKIDKDHYHYAQINFTGFGKLIDDLGGITVNVEKGFSYRTYATYGKKDSRRKTFKFKKGKTEMDGNEALTYARTRKAFANGDVQRNKNQVAVLKGIKEKALSPSILTNYTSVVNTIKNNLDTNIDLSSLVSLQNKVKGHKDYDDWHIASFGVIGSEGDTRREILWDGSTPYSMPVNEQSLIYARVIINKTLKGADFKTLKKLSKQYTASQGQ